jgi:hypothetical protein
LSGCAEWDVRGDSFPEDDLVNWTGKLRQRDPQEEYFGISNKARRIEENLGVK